MRTPIILTLALAVACHPEGIQTESEAEGYTEETVGAFEAVDPSDPNSQWTGVEYTRILDAEGLLLCEGTLDAEGPAIGDPRFDLTLEVVRAEVLEMKDTCSFVRDLDVRTSFESLYLSFEGDEGRFGEERGSVYVGDDLGDAEFYARGVLIDGTLLYHRERHISEDDASAGTGRPGEGDKPLDDSWHPISDPS